MLRDWFGRDIITLQLFTCTQGILQLVLSLHCVTKLVLSLHRVTMGWQNFIVPVMAAEPVNFCSATACCSQWKSSCGAHDSSPHVPVHLFDAVLTTYIGAILCTAKCINSQTAAFQACISAGTKATESKSFEPNLPQVQQRFAWHADGMTSSGPQTACVHRHCWHPPLLLSKSLC